MSFAHPYQADSRNLSKFLLQASVVGLGFGMNLHEVLRAGRSGFVYTAASISFALIFGLLAGRLLRVNKTASILISTGTAICGGSAIAAVAPIIGANDEEIAVSLGTVFILNSIALLIFPPLGWALHLTQQQFGLWAALAIHDTSSVVGATARYGPVRLGRRHHRKTHSRALDRPGCDWRRRAQTLQNPHPMALVYFVLLLGRSRKHVPARAHKSLARIKQSGKAGADRNSLFDRNRNLARHLAGSRLASSLARHNFMDSGRRHIPMADFCRMDCALAVA